MKFLLLTLFSCLIYIDSLSQNGIKEEDNRIIVDLNEYDIKNTKNIPILEDYKSCSTMEIRCDSNLNEIPEFIFDYYWVTKLILKGKKSLNKEKTDTIGVDFLKFKQLEELEIDNLPVVAFDSNVIFKKLKVLKIRYTNINTLPLQILNYKNIECLLISYSPIIEVPINLSNFKNLKELGFVSTDIKEINEGIYKLKNLEKLYIDGTLIDHFPQEFFELQKLTFLSALTMDGIDNCSRICDLKQLKTIRAVFNNECSCLLNGNNWSYDGVSYKKVN